MDREQVDKLWDSLLMSMNTPPAENFGNGVKYCFTVQCQPGAGEVGVVFPHPCEEIGGDMGSAQSKDKGGIGFSTLLLGFGALSFGCLYFAGHVFQRRLVQFGKQIFHQLHPLKEF